MQVSGIRYYSRGPDSTLTKEVNEKKTFTLWDQAHGVIGLDDDPVLLWESKVNATENVSSDHSFLRPIHPVDRRRNETLHLEAVKVSFRSGAPRRLL